MLDRVSQFALAAAAEAIADCRALLERDRPSTRAGVFVGTGMGGAQTTDDGYHTSTRRQSDRVKPFTVLMAMNNAAASWIGIDHGLRARTSRIRLLLVVGRRDRRGGAAHRRGRGRRMIAGGTEAPLTFGTLKAWEALKTLAPRTRRIPQRRASRSRRTAAASCSARAPRCSCWRTCEHARRRGARIHAELAGYGLSTDAEHITRPTVAGQARGDGARAGRCGASDAGDIGYINAHGTGTQANDAVETAAIKAGLRRRGAHRARQLDQVHARASARRGRRARVRRRDPRLCSAGSFRRRTPARPDPECDLDYVAEGARPAPAADVDPRSRSAAPTRY